MRELCKHTALRFLLTLSFSIPPAVSGTATSLYTREAFFVPRKSPRLWREPRERKPLTYSLLIVCINHSVGCLSISASDPVLHKPSKCSQYKVLLVLFFQEKNTLPSSPVHLTSTVTCGTINKTATCRKRTKYELQEL